MDSIFSNLPVKVVQSVRAGLPVAAVDDLLNAGALTTSELHALVLPRKTLANRRKTGTLNPEQSDRLARVARIIAATQDVFGSPDKAHKWLRRPTAALENHAPLHLLDTDEGTRLVEGLLGRIAHGIAA